MKALMSWGGLVLVLVIFLAFNVLAGAVLTRGRIDLTQDKLYTVSEGTRNILENLDEDVTLRFYFSKSRAEERFAGFAPYAARVRDLLEEYVAKSNGKLRLEVADPEPFSDTEVRAASFGLRGIPINSAQEMFYFGLAGTNSTDQEVVIPFFSPDREESLEYDLTKLVYSLANTKKKVIGVITSVPMDGNPMAQMLNPRAPPQEPWMALEYLREGFEVKMIQPSVETLEKDLDVIVLVHPQNLSPSLTYAIDQFVLGGGKVLAFIDPYFEQQDVPRDPQNPMASMMADRSSSLGALGDAWGIEMSKDDIAADKELALRLTMQGQPVDYVVYLGLTEDKDSFDKTDFSVGELKSVNLATPGVLRKKDGATTTITPLMQTTKSSMRVPKSKIQFQPSPSDLLATFQSGGERLMVAARISGNAMTAFPQGKPKGPNESEPPAPLLPEAQILESKGPINVIVVADADMVGDGFWVRVQNFLGNRIPMSFADNGAFIVNAVDNLSGSNDLISLRSRGRSQRPFDKVVELRREAEGKFRQKEKDLQTKLQEANKRLEELLGGKDVSAALYSPELKNEQKRFREEEKNTREELRNVRYELNKDVNALKTRLVLANGFAVPVFILLAGVVVWSMRRKKMKEARESSARTGSS
jgi:ABC-type uncharacterized transport system involved in gliding motility auxiliary subunit